MERMIARLLLKNSAVTLNVKEPYTYSSGIKSPIYCDNRRLLGKPEPRQKIIEAFLEKMKDFEFDIVAGVATAGIPWAAMLADRLGKPLIYVRSATKSHGKQNQIEGAFEKGMRAIVIEDLISTGGSSLAAIDALKHADVHCIACLAIFTYEMPVARFPCPVITLSSFSVLIEEALPLQLITEKEATIAKEWNKNPWQ